MPKQIPFLNLHKQYESIKPEVTDAIKRVLERQMFILGPEVDLFEKEFANYLEVKHVIGVNSGTDGLIIALKALGIGKGDEVITQTNSFVASASAVTEVGATPILVDIDPDTYEIDPSVIEKAVTKKTKAIMPVHLYGASGNIKKIVSLAKGKNLLVIEDACQAHGATYQGKKLGTFGDISVFSFYPGKNMGAYGDAGAIATNNPSLAQKVIQLHNYGQSKKYFHDSFGVNSRLDEIQAAILRIKLRHLDRWNKRRNAIAKSYQSLLKHTKMQTIPKAVISNYHLFVIEHQEREVFQKYLETMGIQTLIHYPVPIHLQKCYKDLGYKAGDFPYAEKAAKQLVSLPMYPELTESEVEYIAQKINAYKTS